MSIQIEVVNVSAPVFVKTAKGGYNQIEVAYKQDGKVTGKKLLDFASPQAYNVLKGAASGSVFLVETSKNAAGYIQWDSVAGASGDAGVSEGNAGETQAETRSSSQERTTGRGAGVSGRVVGSTYETPAERAVKQAAIINQATLNAAIEYTKAFPEDNSIENVLTTARKFRDFVLTDIEALAGSLKAASKS